MRVNAAVVLLLGAAFGLGVLLVAGGLRPMVGAFRQPRLATGPGLRVRLGPAVLGAVAGGLFTRWPVAALAGGAFGFFATDLFDLRYRQGDLMARTEAIAGWAEMIRDTLAGAHGLEEAIVTAAPLAPAVIRPEVAALAVRLGHEPLGDVLPDFAEALAHPTGDLVTVALAMAATGGVRDVGRLLSALAGSARAEAAMRQRVEAGRARTRASVRSVAGCTAVAVVGLVAFKRPYLAPYGSVEGQVVLGVVALMFAGGFAWLGRLSRGTAPQRFLVARGMEVARR